MPHFLIHTGVATLLLGVVVVGHPRLGQSPGHWSPTSFTSPTPPPSACRTDPPPLALSWHIHVLFDPKNRSEVVAALHLQYEFLASFPTDAVNCTFDAGDPQPNRTSMCKYEVDWAPAGPFLTAQYSFFVPSRWFARTVPWVTSRRGALNILVHPNSGCETEDHVQWPMWSGTKQPLDPSIFNCEYPGCAVHSSPIDAAQIRTAPTNSNSSSKVRVGAIRWDNWSGRTSPTSAETAACMGPQQWHSRVPFCGKVINSTTVDFDCATSSAMALELQYAVRAGLSFWAFVQYPETDALSAALANYLAVTDTHGVNFAALIEIGRVAAGPRDKAWPAFLARYDGYFARTEYETVEPGGHPLVFLFGSHSQAVSSFGSDSAFVDVLKAWASHCVNIGTPPPHFVIQDGYNDTFVHDLRLAGAVQSRSSYALGDGVVNGTFDGQIAQCQDRWKEWAANGDDVIPLAATGWDPRDRATGCATWTPNGEGKSWTRSPTPDQVVNVINLAVQWSCTHTASATTQKVLVYAWNENSEGGWLVPTLGEGTTRVDAIHNFTKGSGWTCNEHPTSIRGKTYP